MLFRSGLNFRMDTIQAGIVLAKFKHFEDEAKKRKIIGEKYSSLLKDSVVVPFIEKYTDRSVYAQYSIRVKNRADVIKKLTAKGIPTAVHYPIPMHLQEAYQYLGYKKGDFPVSEKIANEIMSIPMHPFLSDDDIEQIVTAVKKSVIRSGGYL